MFCNSAPRYSGGFFVDFPRLPCYTAQEVTIMKFGILALLLLLLCGCQAPQETLPTVPVETAMEPPVTVPTTQAAQAVDPVLQLLDTLTIEEKVGQLFLARCDNSRALEDLKQYHLGGFVLFREDFENQTRDTIQEKLSGYQAAAKIPLLLAVDEEGGTVCRISCFPAFRDSRFPSPREACQEGGLGWALVVEDEKSQLLADLGLNVNLGPVCDIATDPNAFMYQRSLGEGPEDTGFFVSQTVSIQSYSGIGSVLKHFPGYGSNVDTHVGIARDSRSLEELEGYDLIPFARGIEAGADGVLVAHVILEALDSQNPASLSPAVHQYLRQNMGFDGVIMTDDLVMEAITQAYGAEEAAVLAVKAGNDLLCSTDYITQYQAVLAAVQEGRIPLSQIDEAAYRVLSWKQELGILP